MNEDFDPTDPDTFIDPPVLSKDEIHQELVRMWFDCLRLNEDYESYCKAKRRRDTKTCHLLEQQHSRVSGLFDDWGDTFSDDTGAVSWETWISARPHLFFKPGIDLMDAERPQLTAGTVAISVPTGLSPSELNAMFKAFVTARQDELCDSPARFEPKYKVSKTVSMRTLSALRRAELVYDLHQQEIEFFSEREGKIANYKYSYPRVARTILANRKIRKEYGFEGRTKQGEPDKWASTPELDRKMSEPEVLADEFEPYKSDIRSWVEYYTECISSVIDGVFPAKRSGE